MKRDRIATLGSMVYAVTLTACAATTVREKAVVMEFAPERIDGVSRFADFEQRYAYEEVRHTGFCALSHVLNFEDLKAWAKESGMPATTLEPATSPVPVEAPSVSNMTTLPNPPWNDRWNLDVLGVNITRLDDRPALRVETRFGDYGGMSRVVAWLEACGGKRVDAVR